MKYEKIESYGTSRQNNNNIPWIRIGKSGYLSFSNYLIEEWIKPLERVELFCLSSNGKNYAIGLKPSEHGFRFHRSGRSKTFFLTIRDFLEKFPEIPIIRTKKYPCYFDEELQMIIAPITEEDK